MPGTASSLGVANPLNPAESIEGGARYLSQMMAQFGGNTSEALAAYNAGPGAVSQYGGVPPYAETQSYVTKVLGYAEGYRREHPAAPAGASHDRLPDGRGAAPDRASTVSGAPPGAPPPAHPFKDALAEEWARTATAEGQNRGSRQAIPNGGQPDTSAHGAGAGDEAPPLTAAAAPVPREAPRPDPSTRLQPPASRAGTASDARRALKRRPRAPRSRATGAAPSRRRRAPVEASAAAGASAPGDPSILRPPPGLASPPAAPGAPTDGRTLRAARRRSGARRGATRGRAPAGLPQERRRAADGPRQPSAPAPAPGPHREPAAAGSAAKAEPARELDRAAPQPGAAPADVGRRQAGRAAQACRRRPPAATAGRARAPEPPRASTRRPAPRPPARRRRAPHRRAAGRPAGLLRAPRRRRPRPGCRGRRRRRRCRRRRPDAGHDRRDPRDDRAGRPPGHQPGADRAGAGGAGGDPDPPEPDRRRADGARHGRHGGGRPGAGGRARRAAPVAQLARDLAAAPGHRLVRLTRRGAKNATPADRRGRLASGRYDRGEESIDAVDEAGESRAAGPAQGELVDVLA